jgi:recombination protein RecT
MTQAIAQTNGKSQSFPQMLEQFLPEIRRALPKHMDGDRMARIALTEFRKNPKLGDCDPKSVFASIIIGSQLGLEPGIMGQSFLVPYKATCQFVPGWQGLNDLVSRAGRATTWTGAVREGDAFDYELGDRPFVKHKPGDDEDAPLTHFYAIGRIRGSEWPIIEVWSIKKVTKHRDKYNKVGDRHYSFHNFEMYARKVPLLQVIKYLPKSVELSTAVALEHAANQGEQGLTIKDAIDGTWTPAPVETAEPEKAAPIQQPRAKSQSTAEPEANTIVGGEPGLEMPDGPINEQLVALIKAKLDVATISERELLRSFNVEQLGNIKVSQFSEVLAWIKNPS